ncbi:MAG TPA: hypothetical protein VJQ57_02580 [Acidimicrobiia bacterium]|nr:hypothetical protein [Acidimicrobiia bacterium]
MDPKAWVVAILYGLLAGFMLGRYREEQRAMLGVLAASSLIGFVVWLTSPEGVAGPSLAVGCGLGFLAMLATRRRITT